MNVGVREIFKSIASDILDSCDDEKITQRSESFKLGYINNEYFNTTQKTVNNNQQQVKIDSQQGQGCCFKL
jgi:hypothetical protein